MNINNIYFFFYYFSHPKRKTVNEPLFLCYALFVSMIVQINN